MSKSFYEHVLDVLDGEDIITSEGMTEQIIDLINEGPLCHFCRGYGCDHCAGTGREAVPAAAGGEGLPAAQMAGYVDLTKERVRVALDEPSRHDTPGTRVVLQMAMASIILRVPMSDEMFAQYAAEVERVRALIAAEDDGDVQGVIDHSPVQVAGDVSDGQRRHILMLMKERATNTEPTQEQRDNAALIEAELARDDANVKRLYEMWTAQGMPSMPDHLDPYNNPDDMTRWVAMMQSGMAPQYATSELEHARARREQMREAVGPHLPPAVNVDEAIAAYGRIVHEPAPQTPTSAHERPDNGDGDHRLHADPEYSTADTLSSEAGRAAWQRGQ